MYKGPMKIYTHCDICKKQLPEDERKMGAANHEECWVNWVFNGGKRPVEMVI